MADIGVEFNLRFNANPSDIIVLKKLMEIMIGAGDYEYEETEDTIEFRGRDNEPMTLLYNALLGTLKERQTRFGNVFEGNGDLSLAPMLIAALFQDSTFSYELAVITYSGGAGQDAIRALYDGNELTLWMCDESDRYNLEEYGIEAEGDYEEEIIINYLIEKQFAEDYEDAAIRFEELERELFFKLNGPDIVVPQRDQMFEQSFFKDGDLLDYLKQRC